MPIFIGEVLPQVPTVRELEVPRISWTSPEGRVTEFYGSYGNKANDFVQMRGMTGFDMPIFSPYTDTSPGFDGEVVRGFRTEARDLSLPVLMYSYEGRNAFKQMRNDLLTDMNPRAGVPGVLTVTEWDGSTSRSIEAFYTGGLEGIWDDDTAGATWAKYLIQFRAPDPYWLGATVTPRPLTSVDESGWLPLMPIRVTASQILGNTTITNHGQSDSFPTFTITGPASNIQLLNNTTGEVINLGYELEADDTLTINTRAGRKFIRLNGSTNLYPYLSLDSTLWSLKPGINEVTFTLPDQAPETTLQFSYQERYLAAW